MFPKLELHHWIQHHIEDTPFCQVVLFFYRKCRSYQQSMVLIGIELTNRRMNFKNILQTNASMDSAQHQDAPLNEGELNKNTLKK